MMNNSSVTRRKKDRTTDSLEPKINASFDSDGENAQMRKKLVNKRRKKRKRDEESFIITNIKVGSVIATMCVLVYVLYSVASVLYLAMTRSNDEYGENAWSQYVNDEGNGYNGGIGEPMQKSKIVPNFDISEHKVNAFSVAESLMNQINQIEEDDKESNVGNGKLANVLKIPEKKAIVDVLKALEEVKQTFVTNYGGENAAREIIERGIVTFSPSSSSSSKNVEPEGNIHNMARRIFHAKREKRNFKVSFTGSSAVAGYGNYFNQTFPSVLTDLLIEPFKVLGIELEIRNAAIADIASFPYGWCLDNFMGESVDVVSWDGSLLNRGDTDAAFESYLRRIVALDSSPMLIIREGVYSESKRQILQK